MKLGFIMDYAHSFFLWTISVSIKASILIILILLARVILKGKGGTKFQYLLWFLVILRLTIPDLLNNTMSIYSYVTVPSLNSSYHSQEVKSKTEDALNRLDLKDMSVRNMYYQTNKNLSIDFSIIAFLIWIIGLILILGTIIISNTIFLRKIRREAILTDSTLLNLLDDCKRDLIITKNVVLIGTKEVNVPGLVGIIRPKILLPNNMLRSLNLQNLRYIFLHELTHLKRMDMLINVITSILTAFYWFNPFVWVGFIKMREDCEISCDSYVLSHLKEENEPYLYADTILKISFYNYNRNILPVISHFIKNKSQVKRRIAMIKLFNNKSYKMSALAITVLIMIGLLTFSGTKATSIAKSNLANNNSIVIYCSHPQEMYGYGGNILEIAKETTKRLVKAGLNAQYLEVPINTPRNGAYKVSRKLLQTKVANYKKAILLDLHIDYPVTFKGQKPVENIPKQNLNFVIEESNPLFKGNKKFVNKLINEINKSNKINVAKIVNKELGAFNQDLSPYALLIHIGASNSSKKDVGIYIDSLISALKNITLQN